MVPNSIQIPSTTPGDVPSLSLFLTVMMQQIQNWIALASTQLNQMGGFRFQVSNSGQLTIVSPNGTVTLVANP